MKGNQSGFQLKARAGVAFVIIIAIVYSIYLIQSRPSQSHHLAATNSQARLPPIPPHTYKFSGSPKNAEETAMLDWWVSMEHLDPKFQWKSRINFFGKVVDQHGDGVAGASVELNWNDVTGSNREVLYSADDGTFALKNKQGKVLTVLVLKKGYNGDGKSNSKGFEFSEFWDDNYYVPDPKNPVLFSLWRLEQTEPMYIWTVVTQLPTSGEMVWFDTKKGKFGSTGDVGFSSIHGVRYPSQGFDWSTKIKVAPPGGLSVTDDSLMYQAPADGYQSEWSKSLDGHATNFSTSDTIKFYLRTPEGNYAAMKAEFLQNLDDGGRLHLIAYVSQSNSRNLQYDQEKRINPRH